MEASFCLPKLSSALLLGKLKRQAVSYVCT